MSDPASIVGWIVLAAVVTVFAVAAARVVGVLKAAKRTSMRIEALKARTVVDQARVAAIRERTALLPGDAKVLGARAGVASASLGATGRQWLRVGRAFVTTGRMVGVLIHTLR